MGDLVTRAAVLREFSAPQRVEEVRLRAPGRGEALVRLTAAGVCHSDVGQADGEWEFPLPAVLGHEGAGVVEQVGPGATTAPGTRVLLSLAPGCGRCRHCLQRPPDPVPGLTRRDGRGAPHHRRIADQRRRRGR